MKYKVMALALSVMMLMGNTVSVFANISGINVDAATAMKVAYGFLNARSNEESIEQQVPEGYMLVEDLTMYDMNDNPSAYKFNIVDKFNNYNGYIVVGAQEEYAPVIEFSISKEESFFENAENCDKVYYFGGLEYYGQNGFEQRVYDIQSNETIEGTVRAMIENSPVIVTEKTGYADQWEEILQEIEKKEQCAISTYGAGDIIINPEPYEDGYNSCSIRTMPWATSAPYVTTGDYDDDYSGHCGPVAITNLMILGYNSYDLDLKNGTWDSVFEQICNLAGITNGDGELETNEVRDAAKAYAKKCGYSNSSASLSGPTASRMKGYIEDDVLTILQVTDHYIYNDHYVVPYGYEEYEHDSYTNVYFAIADGWSSNTRYVLFDDDTFTFSIKVNID